MENIRSPSKSEQLFRVQDISPLEAVKSTQTHGLSISYYREDPLSEVFPF